MERHCALTDRYSPFSPRRVSLAFPPGRWLRWCFLIVWLLLLTACGSGPVRPGSHSLERQASAAWESGDYYQAAALYRQIFRQTARPADALMAARAMLAAGEYPAALAWLTETRQPVSDIVSGSEAAQWNLLQAEALAGVGRYPEALELLTDSPENLPDEAMRQQVYRLKSQLQRKTGQLLPAALTQMKWLDWLQQQGVEDVRWQEVADELVAILFAIPEDEIKAALEDEPLNPTQRGWLEAAYIGFGMNHDEAGQWMQYWPEHPARRYFLGVADSVPRRIAVLLPLTGRYAAIARSIQQGMIAAAYAGPANRQLRFFDTGDKGKAVADAYFSALESAPDFIVGPLSRTAVQQLAAMPAPTAPVLALNELPENTLGSGFYQFPLSARDEADDAALRMLAEKHHKAIVVVPETAWGQRVGRAFAENYAFNAGRVLDTVFYDEKSNDHSARLRRGLGLDASRDRARQLQRLIGQKLESAERVDPRIEAIFLAARPRQARMIVPQLKFLHAGHVPVYSTSHIYSGVKNPGQDKDLEGVRFADAPIVVHPQAVQEQTGLDVNALGAGKRYFAFGYDALTVLDRLQWMDTFGTGRIRGLSGDLSLQGNRIGRRLDWARFHRGVPEPLPDIAYDATLLFDEPKPAVENAVRSQPVTPD